MADWTVRYFDDARLLQFQLSLIRDDLVDVRVTGPQELPVSVGAGVDVRISELDKDFRSLSPENAVKSLSEIFAIYLTDYPDVGIYVENERLDPSAMILGRERSPLEAIQEDGAEYPAEIEVIEWRSAGERTYFLCGAEGFPFQRTTPRFHTPGHQFSAYLKSSFVDVLQERGILELSEMNPALEEAMDASAEVIKAQFRAKDAEVASSEIEQWKADQVYPYRAEARTSVEQAERKIFQWRRGGSSRTSPGDARRKQRFRSIHRLMTPGS